MKTLSPIVALALLALAVNAGAAEPRTPPAAKTPPPRPTAPAPPPIPRNYHPPEAPGARDDLEPEITIQTRGTEIHEEYRLHGRLYMVKVTPAKGPPYYLIYDERGDVRRSDLQPDTAIPNWVIKRF